MLIEIVSDAICPWCFVGKRRLERALAIAPPPDLKIGWRPFQLNPDMPPDGMDRKEYLRLKFGDGDGGQMYTAISEAGQREGIGFAFDKIKRTPNTILAHRLIRYSAGLAQQDAVVEALFRTYFLDGADIGRVETLVGVCEQLGLDGPSIRRYLESDEDVETVRAEDAYARQIGIEGVPCFIIERKFAISGAQAPEVFVQAFEHVREEAARAPQPAVQE